MRLPACVISVVVLAGCGGTADLVPMKDDVRHDNGRAAPEVRGLTCAASSLEAPFETTCSFELSTSDTSDVLCTLSVTGGVATPSQMTACKGGEFKVQVRDVGISLVEVRAQREGGSALRSSIELQGLNSAPKIKTFVSSRKQGTAPVTATLSWELEDSNADAVSCEVQVDGAVVSSLPDCLASKTLTHTFESGEHTAKLIVSDARGAKSSSEVTIRGVPAVGDVRVVRAEFGQTILSPTLRLVPGKAAMVRVFILSDTSNLALTAKLSRMVAGSAVETVTLTGPSTAPTLEDPSTLQKSYSFKLPIAWIEQNLELRVEADPDDLLPETNEANNTLTLKPAVGEPNSINVTAVPVIYNGSTATVPDFQGSVMELFAVKSVGRKDRAPYTFTGSFVESAYGGWSNLLGDVASLRNADASQDHYYGVIDTGQGGGIAGLGFLGQPAAVGLSYYGHVMPHELGHNLSLPHAPCGPVSGASSNYPYAGGEIGTYGISVEQMQLVPNTFKDLMSYCQPTWISDFYYKQSQNFIEAQSYQAPSSTPPAPMVLVHGFATKDGRATLKPVHRLLSWPTENKGAGLLTMQGEHGTVETRFVISEEAEDGGLHFSVLVADPGEIRSLEISLGGSPVVVKTAEHSAVSAEAQITERTGAVRVRWDAKKHPSATLAWVNGNERVTFAFDLRGGDVDVKTGALPTGGAFEVSLSDGLNAVNVSAAR